CDALPYPMRQRLPPGTSVGTAEAGGHSDLVAPRLTSAPSGPLEVIGGRGKRVGDAVHQVPATVTIEINCQPTVCRRNELGMAEGAGPRPDQLVGGDITIADDPQRGQQLAPEEILPPSHARQRRQRLK